MTEQQFQDCLYMLLQTVADEAPTDDNDEFIWPGLRVADDIQSVRSFVDDQVLTYNKGLTVKLVDGSEFQLTIVKSK